MLRVSIKTSNKKMSQLLSFPPTPSPPPTPAPVTPAQAGTQTPVYPSPPPPTPGAELSRPTPKHETPSVC